MKRLFWIILPLLLLIACQKDSTSGLKELNLLEYGLPVTIMAPDSAVVKAQDLGGLIKDVTIKGGEDYSLQIYASAANTTDISEVKARQLEEVKDNRYFSKIVEEEENGFLYKMEIDSNNINYGFRHIKIQGDMEYIFQTALVGTFSEEEARTMYEAVK